MCCIHVSCMVLNLSQAISKFLFADIEKVSLLAFFSNHRMWYCTYLHLLRLVAADSFAFLQCVCACVEREV